MSAAVAQRNSPHIPRPASRTHSPMDGNRDGTTSEGEWVVYCSFIAVARRPYPAKAEVADVLSSNDPESPITLN